MPWELSRAEVDRAPRPLVALARDLADGERIEPHRHARAQLIHAARGTMKVTTATGAWIVPPGRALWMPAGTSHAIAIVGAVEMRTLYLAPDAPVRVPAGGGVVQVTPLLRELMLRCVDLPLLYDEAGADGRLVAVILDELERLPSAPLHLPLPRDKRLAPLVAAILAEPGDRRTAGEWAGEIGVGERTLSRVLRREIGLSFGAWRQQARLMAAVASLAEGARVDAVARDLGYESPSAFIAMFRRALGTTPGRFLEGDDGTDGAAGKKI